MTRLMKTLSMIVIFLTFSGALFCADETTKEPATEPPSITGNNVETTDVIDATPAGGLQKSAGKEKDKELTLWGVIALGGKLMYVLAFLSFMTIVLITFYFLSLTPSNAMPPLFAQRLHEMLRNRRIADAKIFCEQHDNSLSRILRKGFSAMERGRDAVIEAMQSEGQRQASALWQRISYLADIGVVAPMVGLLGTVLGMMHLFMGMRESLAIGGFKPTELAGGIFEAIVTTVAGLIIAIIATGFYAYFRGVVQRMIVNLEEISLSYADLLDGGQKK